MMTQFFLLAGVALLAPATLEETPPPGAGAPRRGDCSAWRCLTRYDTILFLVPLAAVLLWGMGPARRTRPVLAALGTLALFCVQSWLHQRFVAPFYQPLGGMVGGFLAAAALLVAGAPARAPHRRLAAARRRRPCGGRRRCGSRRRRCSACWVLFGWFVRPGLAGPGLVGRLFRRLAGDPPLSGFAQLLSGAESGNMLYLVDLLGAVGLLAAVAGIAALVVSRRRLWETAWLAASVARAGGLHAQRLPRPLPDVGEPAVRPGGHAARQRRDRRRRRLRRGRAAGALAGSSPGRASRWSRRSSGSTPAPPARWRAGASGPGLIAWYERFEKAIPAGRRALLRPARVRRAAAVHLRAPGVRAAGRERPSASSG